VFIKCGVISVVPARKPGFAPNFGKGRQKITAAEAAVAPMIAESSFIRIGPPVQALGAAKNLNLSAF
jgi:hypothetical protein